MTVVVLLSRDRPEQSRGEDKGGVVQGKTALGVGNPRTCPGSTFHCDLGYGGLGLSFPICSIESVAVCIAQERRLGIGVFCDFAEHAVTSRQGWKPGVWHLAPRSMTNENSERLENLY